MDKIKGLIADNDELYYHAVLYQFPQKPWALISRRASSSVAAVASVIASHLRGVAGVAQCTHHDRLLLLACVFCPCMSN
jgi:hypothetical protein